MRGNGVAAKLSRAHALWFGSEARGEGQFLFRCRLSSKGKSVDEFQTFRKESSLWVLYRRLGEIHERSLRKRDRSCLGGGQGDSFAYAG